MNVNDDGVIVHQDKYGCTKDWWLIKHASSHAGRVRLDINLPARFIGKTVRFVVQVIPARHRCNSTGEKTTTTPRKTP